MRILISGANGLVGSALVRHCQRLGDQVLCYPRETLNIVDADLVDKTITQQQPEVVINCAAWTDVDGCESDEARAFHVNSLGP